MILLRIWDERPARSPLLGAGLVVGTIDGLRFRGTPLAEEDREDDHRGDREELALPVLKGLEPEARGPGILEWRQDSELTVRSLLLVVVDRAGHSVECNTDEKNQEEGEREGVLVQLRVRTL